MGFTKSEYTEAEAAVELGVSVDQLRSMIQAQVLREGDDLNELRSAVFPRSDLVVLRLLLALQSGGAGVIRS